MGAGGGRGGLRNFGGLGSGLSGDGGGPNSASASLGGWALGAQARELPQGLSSTVSKGSDLILATHFHASGKAEKEASTVALYFADKAPTQRFTGIQMPFGFGILAGIDIPAGKKDFTIRAKHTVPADIELVTIHGHAHYICESMKAVATLPDGGTKPLLSIPKWDFNWQDSYTYKTPVRLLQQLLAVLSHWFPERHFVCSADGNPRRMSSRSRFGSRRHCSDMPPSLRRSWRTTATSRKRNMYRRDIDVAHPEPSAPIAGKPRLPKTSSQLTMALMMLALTNATMTTRTMPTACR